MPVSLSTVCEASLVSPLSALGRFLTFALFDDSKAGRRNELSCVSSQGQVSPDGEDIS